MDIGVIFLNIMIALAMIAVVGMSFKQINVITLLMNQKMVESFFSDMIVLSNVMIKQLA